MHQAADQFALSWDIPEAQSSGTEEKVASKRPSADGETSGLVHEAEVVLSMPCIARGRSRHYASRYTSAGSWLRTYCSVAFCLRDVSQDEMAVKLLGRPSTSLHGKHGCRS